MDTPTSKFKRPKGLKVPELGFDPRLERWVAWVPFPDGSRQRIKRKDKADAQADLEAALAQRAEAGEKAARTKQLTWHEVFEFWVKAGCPAPPDSKSGRHVRVKSVNTLDKISYRLARLDISYAKTPRSTAISEASIGSLIAERTSAERLSKIFELMDRDDKATGTIHDTWQVLFHSAQYALRMKKIKQHAVNDVPLPAARPPKERKSFVLEQVGRLMFISIPVDPRAAMWFTGLMCGLRPAELAGLRWCYVDIDSDDPHLMVEEQAHEEIHKYVGQCKPKGGKKAQRTIGLHPLVVAALTKHRDDLIAINQYRYNDTPFAADGFVFPTSTNRPIMVNNLGRYFKAFCKRAGVGDDWTTYEMRHSFVTLAHSQLENLEAVSKLVGHASTKTTQGYLHDAQLVRPTQSTAMDAWTLILSNSEVVQQLAAASVDPN